MTERRRLLWLATGLLVGLWSVGCSSDSAIGQGEAADADTLNGAGAQGDALSAPQAGVREPTQNVASGGLVILDGTTSRGVNLIYSWQQIFGTTVELSSDTGAVVTFRAPEVNLDRVLIFRLTVTDESTQLSAEAETHILVAPSSASPSDPTPDPDPSTSACATAADCIDDDICNGMEACVGGTCMPGSALICDDGVFCNGVEGCHPVDGCTAGEPPCPADMCLESEARCPTCMVDVDCDDGDACTTQACVDGVCELSETTACPEGATCDPVTGLCSGADAPADPVVAYTFEEGAGTVVRDASPRMPAMDLVLDGAVSWLADGPGVTFDGGRIGTVAAATKLIDALTVAEVSSFEILCSPTTLDQVGPARLLSVGNDIGDQSYVLGQINGDLQVRLLHTGKDNDAKPRLSTADAPLDLTLQHIVHTYDGATERLYINGVAQSATVAAAGSYSNWDPSDRFNVGNEGSNDRPWRGVVYYVAVHDRTLTATEITALYQAAVAGGTP